MSTAKRNEGKGEKDTAFMFLLVLLILLVVLVDVLLVLFAYVRNVDSLGQSHATLVEQLVMQNTGLQILTLRTTNTNQMFGLISTAKPNTKTRPNTKTLLNNKTIPKPPKPYHTQTKPKTRARPKNQTKTNPKIKPATTKPTTTITMTGVESTTKPQMGHLYCK